MATKRTRKSTKTTDIKSSKPASRSRKNVQVSTTSHTQAANTQSVPMKFKKSQIIVAAVIVVIVALLYIFRSLFIVAIVNGQPINRLTYTQELEKQSGKQVLNTLVTKTLIQQEADREHVTVSSSDVNSELNKIQASVTAQGQTLDQVLALQGMTRETLLDQIKYQLLIQKMVGKNIKISNNDIANYISKNKDSFPANASDADKKQMAESQLQQQDMNAATTSFIQNLQKKAKIQYLVSQ